jgi:hypothetical protein
VRAHQIASACCPPPPPPSLLTKLNPSNPSTPPPPHTHTSTHRQQHRPSSWSEPTGGQPSGLLWCGKVPGVQPPAYPTTSPCQPMLPPSPPCLLTQLKLLLLPSSPPPPPHTHTDFATLCNFLATGSSTGPAAGVSPLEGSHLAYFGVTHPPPACPPPHTHFVAPSNEPLNHLHTPPPLHPRHFCTHSHRPQHRPSSGCESAGSTASCLPPAPPSLLTKPNPFDPPPHTHTHPHTGSSTGPAAGVSPLEGSRLAYFGVAKFQEFSPLLSTGPHLAVPHLDQAAADLLSLTTG